MWRNFFFFSKGERIGIIVLICLIGIVLVINGTLSYWLNDKTTDPSVYRSEIESFKASLKQNHAYTKRSSLDLPKELFHFDPNKLDSAEFVRLGIPTYVVARILKYRMKGGFFTKPEDLARIYGMDESLYAELQPYINIEPRLPKKAQIKKEKKENINPESKTSNVKKENLHIELNSADSATLVKLKGIGSVYAQRIIRYRDYLGGFYQAEQLMDVYGISEDLFLSLNPYLTVDKSAIRKINLNQGDLNYRLKHPYLKKEQLTALIAFQKKNRTIASLEVLREIEAFSDEELERLFPYLSLE